MSTHIIPNQDQLAELMKLRKDKPVVMINLLKFRKKTKDGQATGEERYMEYSKNVMPFLKESGGEITFMGKAHSSLIGPESEHWHHVALVKYPSIAHFLQMIQSKDYPHQLRNSALADSRLIPCLD